MKNKTYGGHFLQCRHTGCKMRIFSNAVTVCPNCDKNPFVCAGNCACRKATQVHYVKKMILNAQGEKGVARILDKESDLRDRVDGLKSLADFKKAMGW